MEKINFQKIEHSKSEEPRERELGELSKKAVKIFKKKLDSIPELEKPKEFGDIKIIKEADAIIYQIPKALGYDFDKFRYDLPFEIGLGDPKDREKFRIHLRIKNEIGEKLKISIEERIRGLVFIDKEAGINLIIDPKQYFIVLKELFEEDIKVLNYFQNMLERYGIKKLWVSGKEKNVLDILNKLVWDVQSSAYAKEKGMTHTEFLRKRLLWLRDDEDLFEPKDNNNA